MQARVFGFIDIVVHKKNTMTGDKVVCWSNRR